MVTVSFNILNIYNCGELLFNKDRKVCKENGHVISTQKDQRRESKP